MKIEYHVRNIKESNKTFYRVQDKIFTPSQTTFKNIFFFFSFKEYPEISCQA